MVAAKIFWPCEQTSTSGVRDRLEVAYRRPWRSDSQRIGTLQVGEHVSEHRPQRKRAA